jgi:hypothetical protein
MTTPEHKLVGIHVAIALGIHRRWGWKTVALAGLASNIPDWDGVPMMFDMHRFEDGHRVWGHNAMAIVLTSLVVGWIQSRYSWIEKIEHWIRFKVSSITLLVLWTYLIARAWARGLLVV